jgi:hypothetical protein
MADLVVTCPKHFWWRWIEEGDAAGAAPTGEEWGWFMGGRRPPIGPGDRLYVVAWNRLRGYAPVTALHQVGVPGSNQWCICRRGDAVAVTIPERIPGFRGWRKVWWPREHELPFADWQTFGVELKRRAA